MNAVATFDIGTTAVKAVLVDASSNVLWQGSEEIPTLFAGDRREQDPRAWWAAFKSLFGRMREAGADICAICMSGQMQDVIPVGADLEPLCPAILYSDGRAREQARRILDLAGAERIARITGNPFDGSIPLPKIVQIREEAPELYDKARAFLISSKDYVIARLTGVCAGDRTACSTAGCMDIETGAWSEEMLDAAGVSPEKLPWLCAAHEAAGHVTAQAARETGCPQGIPVYAGAGDAGATSLASGLARPGQYNINLGTSGWVATVSTGALRREGVFNLSAMPQGLVINVVPFLNGANVHRFVSTLFSHDASPDYAHVDALLTQAAPGAHGVTALPYLVGERFPVLDASARAAYVGMTPETTQADLAQAMLEAVAFSIRQGLAQMDAPPDEITLIGGGARVAGWRQILADVLHAPVTVFGDADTLPARAIAAAAWIGEGVLEDYGAFVERLKRDGALRVDPRERYAGLYDECYERYLKLYPALKGCV
ncbi:MAG: hypothetical protein E7317_09565 [Clostridiales bacterium]|nr:hypothetical protein [Clostridiales bacterium]